MQQVYGHDTIDPGPSSTNDEVQLSSHYWYIYIYILMQYANPTWVIFTGNKSREVIALTVKSVTL